MNPNLLSPETAQAEKLARSNVWNLAWISFLNDLGSELLARLVPFFLSGLLGAPMAVVGGVEGLAESTATLLKPVFGRLSDKNSHRKTFIFWGYLLSSLARPFLAFAASWPEVAFVRWCDRLGKGVRTAPRDALIADSGHAGTHGRNFGLNRSLDTFGALISVGVFAAWSWSRSENDLTWPTWRLLCGICAIPGLLAVVLTLRGVSDTRVQAPSALSAAQPVAKPPLPAVLKRYFAVIALFSLANSSDAFILLRAKELHYTLPMILGAIALLNIVSALTAIPAAALSDRFGRRTLIALGWAIYAGSYAAFGLIDDHANPALFGAVVAVYGLFFGFTEGVERAWIADLAPRESRGSAYGTFGLIVGAIALPASLGFGWAWDTWGSSVSFLASAAIAMFATALLFLLLPKTRKAVQG